MKTEDKELLLKDLCARLPYGVICRFSVKGGNVFIDENLKFGGFEHFFYGTMAVKPYLRPVSSMTEEEREEFAELQKGYLYRGVPTEEFVSRMDEFLNSHHLDFRGLIPMGLALEAPEDMYEID